MSPNTDRFRVLRRLPEIKFEDELRGYSKSQVDRVLESLAPLADDVDELMSRLSEAETRAASAEARLVEHSPNALAQPAGVVEATPSPTVIEEPSAPEPMAAPVAATVPQTSVDFDETLRNTMVLAQRTADTAVREANDEAARIRAEDSEEIEQTKTAAHEETESIRAENERTRTELADATEAERVQLGEDLRAETETRRAELEAELETAHGEERTALISQIDELQRTRDILNGDIETLAIHLDARRTAIRRAVEELTLALDDPARLTDVDVPGLESGEDLDPDAFAPISLGEEEPESAPAQSSAMLLGEAGPAPEPVGDATQPIDVLSMDDDEIDDVVSTSYDSAADGNAADDSAAISSAAMSSAGNSNDDVDRSVDDLETADADESADVSGGGESTQADAPVTDPWIEPKATTPADAQGAADRPAWADSVPTDDELAPVQGGGHDPFLDELRRVTDAESEGEDDEALSRFLSEDSDGDDGGKGGWFGRKR